MFLKDYLNNNLVYYKKKLVKNKVNYVQYVINKLNKDNKL